MTSPLSDLVTGEQATCRFCGGLIAACVDPYSGIIDWGTVGRDGTTPEDFGCGANPNSDAEGVDNHDPGPGHTPVGFHTRPEEQP